jgi:hypothetical protein
LRFAEVAGPVPRFCVSARTSMVSGNGAGMKLGGIPPSGLPGMLCSATAWSTSNASAPQPDEKGATRSASRDTRRILTQRRDWKTQR